MEDEEPAWDGGRKSHWAGQQDARHVRAAGPQHRRVVVCVCGGVDGEAVKAQDDPDTQRHPSYARPGPGAPELVRAQGRVGLLSCMFRTFHHTGIHLL